MIDFFQSNRLLKDDYRKSLMKRLSQVDAVKDLAKGEKSKRQDFYLKFKNELAPIALEEWEALKKEALTEDECYLLELKQTALADTFLEVCFQAAVSRYNTYNDRQHNYQELPIALIAQGSYGREEMSFFSDVDIQIVSPYASKEDIPEDLLEIIHHFEYLFVFQEILPFPVKSSYCFVDISIDVLDSEAIARFIPLLQNRLITGNPEVYSRFEISVRAAIQHHMESIIEYCSRQKGYYDISNTVFQQEPNVKEELRRLYWALTLVRIRHKLQPINQFELLYVIYEENIITPVAFKKIQKAFNFLSKVRLLLHCCQKGIHSDVLNYEVRDKIAEGMGEDVKSFFQKYYFEAVYPLKRYSRNLFWESVAVEREAIETLSEYFGVNADQQIVFLKDPKDFEPSGSNWMFKIFSWVAEFDYHLSYPVTLAMEEHLDATSPLFLGAELESSAQECFHSVIRGKYFARALRLMHEFGLIGNCFIKEFRDITGLLQDIYVHKFPTDMHVLSALDALNGLDTDPEADPFLSELLRSVKNRETLTLSVLLHDIGKGAKTEGQNEELVGARLAVNILNYLGYGSNPKMIKHVAFLVEKHLSMWDIMLLDPEEDETHDMVWDMVRNRTELFKMLILLTYADRGGTKIKMSKAQIEQLKIFYQLTLHYKKRSNVSDEIKLQFLAMTRLPRELQSQLEIYNEFVQSGESFSAELLFKPEAPTELIVCAKDTPKMLYHIAAVLAFNHLSLVEANIQTLDQNVFDVFKVQRATGEFIDYSDFFFVQKQTLSDLRKIFIDKVPLAELYHNRTLWKESIWKKEGVKLKLKVIGRAIKVATHDTLGCFFMEAKAFADSQIEVQRAILQHHQGTAVNIFYVRQKDAKKIISDQDAFTSRLKSLLKKLTDSPAALLEDSV
ncbi:MAG: hypothetical protein COV66_01915 [Nitrospinae bacterium CG11_big_fil_rev_8_21_14_0_20_45_15]|nr:MAG: hypothetical protein COV66_01915 [Nitrospinae bacterium CG11_big_fil_rev_8_21_14_0_20_45_15]